jgi:hypothetical protein
MKMEFWKRNKELIISLIILGAGCFIIALVNHSQDPSHIKILWYIEWITFSGLVWTAWETTNLRKQGQKSLDIQTSPVLQLKWKGENLMVRNVGSVAAFNTKIFALVDGKTDFQYLLVFDTEINTNCLAAAEQVTINVKSAEISGAMVDFTDEKFSLGRLLKNHKLAYVGLNYCDLELRKFYSIFCIKMSDTASSKTFYETETLFLGKSGFTSQEGLQKLNEQKS